MKPRLVGITGGIGSGKSTISKCLQTMGYLVFNADDQASIALDHNLEVVQYVKDLLGNEAYHVNGKANRAFIASKVFSDSQLLKQLNTVLHPVVRNMFDDWVAAHKGEKILFKEAAILFGGLATSIRLRILWELHEGERTASELLQLIPTTQANLSQHLNKMHRAGFLGKDRRGRNVYYWVQRAWLGRVCHELCRELASKP